MLIHHRRIPMALVRNTADPRLKLTIVLNLACLSLISPKHLRSTDDGWRKRKKLPMYGTAIAFHLHLITGALAPLMYLEQAANFDKFHKMCWFFIGLLGTILQTLYQPFETHYPKAVAFTVTIVIYFSSLLAELILRTNGRNHVTVNTLSSFLGVLAFILPILIIVPVIGWLALGIWGCVFGIVVRYLYFQIRNEFLDAVEEIKRVMNTLRNGNANEQQVSGMPDENQQQHQHQHHELPV